MRPLASLTALSLLGLACSGPGGSPPADEARAPATSPPPAAVTVGTATGQRAPDFRLPSAAGGSFQLSEHLGQRVVLVFFRGTW